MGGYERRTKQQRDDSHDAAVAARVLRKFRPQLAVAAVAKQLGRAPTLADVGALVPEFPVNVFGVRVDYVVTVSVADMLGGKFWQTPLFREYDRQLEARGIDDQRTHVGMVFSWPGLGEVIFHTWPRVVELHERQKGYGRILLMHRNRVPPGGGVARCQLYVLERFDTFLESVQEAVQ